MQSLSKPVQLFPPEPLTRLLRQWGIAPVPPAPAAARLGSWLGWADAIEISGVLNTPPGRSASKAARSQAIAWASTELAQVQAELTLSFHHSAPDDAATDAEAFTEQLTPCMQHFGQQQRVMASRISTFRARLRDRLASVSDELARLAQLDEYIERALAAPERQALAGLAALLETRARKHHAADPRRWRARLSSDLQRLLRAELDQRLQPVLGLIEALSTKNLP